MRSTGKIDEGIVEYREVIRLEPGFAQAHMNLGIVFCDFKHDYAAAESEFRTVIRLTPDNALAYSNLGNALGLQGRFAEAVAAYRDAIRLKPDSAEALNSLGGLLRLQGQFDQAVAAYRDAIRKKPDFAVAHNNLADTLNMHPDPARREPEVAIEHARKATELNPEDGAAFNTLGVAQFRASHLELALASFRKSMELRQGGDPYDWFFLAMIEHGRGKAEDAARWFDKSVAWMKEQKAPDAGLLPIWIEAAKLLGLPGPEATDRNHGSDPKVKS